ncbi:MAG: arylsulfatase [Nitrosopumilaceae archaeon]
MILTNPSLTTLMVAAFFASILLFNTNIFAQEESGHSYFFSKGKSVYSSHFPGISIWTLLIDDKVKFIYQAEEDRVVLKADVVPSQECNQTSNSICFDGTVTDVINPTLGAITTGDTFKITIDPDEKSETVSFLSGFLENVDVKIGLQKSRTNLSTDSVKESQTTEDSRPNILVAVLDDTGFADLAFTGSEVPTPTIDALRSEGKLFTNFHTLPTCSPTRSVLMTGVDNHLNGLGTMVEMIVPNQKGKPGYEGHLNDNVVTIPQLLKDSGYHTYMTGKWHLAYGAFDPTQEWEKWSRYDPHARGFEETFSVEIPGSHFTNLGLNSGHVPIALRNGEKVEYPQQYIDDVFTDNMIQFMDKNRDDGKPMFMYLSFWNNHMPIQAPQEYIKKYEGMYDAGWDKIREQRFEKQKELGLVSQDMVLPPGNNLIPAWDSLNATQQKQEAKKMEIFAAMLDSLDHNLGRVVTHLKETGEYDNTIIFVFADNGAEASDPTKVGHGADPKTYHQWLAGTYDNTFSNWGNGNSLLGIGPGWAQVGNTPLLREKGYETEGGTRVPMIVKMTGTNPESSSDAFTQVADVSGTILDYAQVQHPGTTYNGQQIHPIDGKSLRPILEGKAQRIYNENEPVGAELFGNSVLYKGDWKALKLAPPLGDGKWRLYNLKNDIGETTDLSEKNPELLAEMIKDYEDYAKRVGVVPPEGFLAEEPDTD